jgi:cytochrome c5
MTGHKQTSEDIVAKRADSSRSPRNEDEKTHGCHGCCLFSHPHRHDGTEWHVIVKYGPKAIAIEGADAYPEGKGTDPSHAFQKLMAAVSRLLSGKEFK